MKHLILNLLIFLLLSFNNLVCQNNYNIWNAAKKTGFNYSHNPENKNQNLELSLGLHISEDNNSNRSDYCMERKEANIWLHSISDYLYFGLNFNSDSNHNLSANINFKLLDFFVFENLDCMKYNYSGNMKLLNFISDNVYERKINWIDYKHGIGYDFINKHDQQFIPFVYVGIGYNSYHINEKSLNIFSQKFTNFEINAGSHIYLLLNPISFELKSNYSKLMDAPNLDIVSFSAEFRYIKQELTKYWGMDWGYDYYLKDYALYLCLDYNKFFVKDESQDFISFKLGFDYYFQNKIY